MLRIKKVQIDDFLQFLESQEERRTEPGLATTQIGSSTFSVLSRFFQGKDWTISISHIHWGSVYWNLEPESWEVGIRLY